MYEERPMNHLPLNCEGRVLVNLLEGWRRDKDIMREITKEGWKPLAVIRKSNLRQERREMHCKDLFRYYGTVTIADILGVSESTVCNHLNAKSA